MGQRYNFLDFCVNTQKHQLKQAGKRLDITSTAYKLLAYFIEHPGVTLTRQQIINQVWTDRIVSETSLDKLIQRLRKILGDTKQHKNIISTVHGEGFVFLPEVRVSKNTSQVIAESKSKKPFKFFAYILLPIILLVYYASTDIDRTDDIPLMSQAQAKPLVISLIPDITTLTNINQKWMTQGGMHYLNEKFKGVTGLKTNRISLRKLAESPPKRFAIELSNKALSDSSIIVSVAEKNQSFNANVIIRDKHGVVAEKSFTAATIKFIYDEVYNWSLGVLNIEAIKKHNSFDITMSENRYAVENYIRGISAQVSGDAQQAIKYFELATDEDSKFWLAWYQLSVSYRRQGQYEKAMAIVKVFEKANVNNKFMIMVINSRVNIHNALGEFEQGLEAVDSAISLAKNIDSISSQSILLSNKAYTASQLGKYQLALDSILESIDLTKQLDKNDHAGLGYSYSTLSGIQKDMNQLDLAEASAKKAIEYLDKADNRRYSAKIKLRLADIVAKKGEWTKAENLLNESLLTLTELGATLEQSTVYIRLIELQIQTGKFESATNNYRLLNELMSKISSKDQANYFLYSKANLMLATNQLLEAESVISQLKATSINDFHLMNYYLLALKYYNKTNDPIGWLKTAQEFTNNNNFGDQPIIYLTKAQIAIQENHLDLATDAFDRAKSDALKSKNVLMIANIINPYIEFLLGQNYLKLAQLSLLEMDKFNVPTYPYLKTKAHVLFKQGKTFKAASLLEELKSIANDLWSIDDQLLLEKYQLQLNKSHDLRN